MKSTIQFIIRTLIVIIHISPVLGMNKANISELTLDELTLLFQSIRNGNIETAKNLVDKIDIINTNHINIIRESYDGYTILGYAVQLNHIDFAKYLIEQKNADINRGDDYPIYPLHNAISNKDDTLSNLNFIQYLLNKGADINIPDIYGQTPLFYTVRDAQFNLMECLINAGANVNLATYDKETPLSKAVKEFLRGDASYLNSIKLLLANNATYSDISDNTTNVFATILKSMFKAIKTYKDDVVNINGKDALTNAITLHNTNNSASNKFEWLTLALINKHHKQIQYAIDQNLFTAQEILEGLALRPGMPLDMFNALWDQVDVDQRATLLRVAKEHNNKNFGKKLQSYNASLRLITGKNINEGEMPELTKHILSFQ